MQRLKCVSCVTDYLHSEMCFVNAELRLRLCWWSFSSLLSQRERLCTFVPGVFVWLFSHLCVPMFVRRLPGPVVLVKTHSCEKSCILQLLCEWQKGKVFSVFHSHSRTSVSAIQTPNSRRTMFLTPILT